MELIILLVALAALHYEKIPEGLQRDTWYYEWRDSLTYLPDGWLRLLVALALPVLGLDLLLRLVDAWAFGLVTLIIATVALLYSFGRGDLDEDINALADDAEREDTQGIFHRVETLLVEARASESGAEDSASLASQAVGALSYRFLEHVFAVVFWFFVLGPAASLFYRLLWLEASGRGSAEPDGEHRDAETASELDSDEMLNLTRKLLYWAEWLPVRVLGLILALVGNFSACIETWLESLVSSESSSSLLRAFVATSFASRSDREIEAEGAALDGDLALRIRSLKPLFFRCILAWLVFVAVITVSF